MKRALATTALGVALCLAGGAFDSVSLYVPGVGLVLAAVVAAGWGWLGGPGAGGVGGPGRAAGGAAGVRAPGPARVMEEEAYPLRLSVRSGIVPPPGGELLEP